MNYYITFMDFEGFEVEETFPVSEKEEANRFLEEIGQDVVRIVIGTEIDFEEGDCPRL